VKVAYGGRLVLEDASLSVLPGQCLAVVGESGSGKTTMSRALAGLVEPVSGDIRIHGERVAGRARARTSKQRKQLQIVFQNPYGSLNPRRTIGDSIASPIRYAFGHSRAEAEKRTAGALRMVALNPSLAAAYPDQLSGGERQRAAIARALVCDPEVLICDEVTSALDVSIQASIVNLLVQLKEERGLALLFVTHNLPLVSSIAEQVVVLQRGAIVERGPVGDVLRNPQHVYTQDLLQDTPNLALGRPAATRT
jgi:peptide/nickel transport system ATP-binding protein